METGSEKKKEHREITYQVGWKKGKIEWKEAASMQVHLPTADQELSIAAAEKSLRRLWRAAPPLPGAILLPLLYTLPAACFVLTVILVYGLRHAG